MDEPQWLHEPYIARNAGILQALRDGDRDKAEVLLAACLEVSLERVVEVYRRRVGEDGQDGRRCDDRRAGTQPGRLGCCQTEDLVCAP